MAGIKSLAKDTAIYGISSIVGKFLNWGLTPMYTRVLPKEDYGIITNLYGWTAFLLVLLTYGMETGFFRFANKAEGESNRVYSTTLISIGGSTLLFLALTLPFSGGIASLLSIGNFPEYVTMLLIIVAMDALSAIPFAYLRYKKRPIRFASLKMLFIFLNIVLNIFFLVSCPSIHKSHPELISWFYRPDFGAGYVLVANLIATLIGLLALIPQLVGFKYELDKELLVRMLKYSFPLLILGLAGIVSQTADKIFFPFLYPNEAIAMEELGVYGANFKIAVVMVMFTQAFRFAYEPFVFSRNKGEDSKKLYADAMKYFIIISLLIFLGIMFYMDLLKYIVDPSYFEGLRVVPIVMIGQAFFGIYFNLSIWYKLIDETQWGAWFSVIGSSIIVLGNVLYVPVYGYIACAWATVVGYAIIMVISYFFGQKKYPIQYDLKGAAIYTLLSVVLYLAYLYVDFQVMAYNLIFRTGLLAVFVIYMVKKDLPLNEIPVLKKWTNK